MSTRLFFSLVLFLALPLRAATDFTLPGIDGHVYHLSDYRGKWVVVNYWATWCPPCLAEIPELIRFHKAHKDKDAVVLGINHEDIDPQILKDFIADFHINYPVLLGDASEHSPLGDIPGLPMTYVVDPQGRVAARKLGGTTEEELDHFISNNASSH